MTGSSTYVGGIVKDPPVYLLRTHTAVLSVYARSGGDCRGQDGG